MKKIVILILSICSLAGCVTIANDTITLTKEETKKAQVIAEQRYQLQWDRMEAANKFQQREAELNLQSAKLCVEFKKSHKLAPNSNYVLDEWNGQLTKGVN